jgi:hypothetical protein
MSHGNGAWILVLFPMPKSVDQVLGALAATNLNCCQRFSLKLGYENSLDY